MTRLTPRQPILLVLLTVVWGLHWQDWAAVALMVVSIASVLWPSRPAQRS